MTRVAFVSTLALSALAAGVASTAETKDPPPGFVALFNGVDLEGWRGNPTQGTSPKLLAMSPEERKAAQAEADEGMRANWKVENGEIVNPDGKGVYLETAGDYADFELFIDWRIAPGTDSGIYVRGTPQIQIWDPVHGIEAAKVGSGGLYNNQRGPSKPLVRADEPAGEWNRFRILMIGETCTVWLNDQLVVNEVRLENYWDRSQPLWSSAPIQLQTHGGELRFRNVFIREIPRRPPESGVLAADGRPVGDGWLALLDDGALKKHFHHEPAFWEQDAGVLTGTFAGDPEHHHAYTDAIFGDFELHCMVRMQGENANSGIVIRGKPTSFDDCPGYQIDMGDGFWGCLWEERRDGMVDAFPKDAAAALVKKDDWNHYYVIARGSTIEAWLNGVQTINVVHPRGHAAGAIGFQLAHGTNRNFTAQFKDLWIRPLRENPSILFEAPPPGEHEAGFVAVFNGKNLDGWTGKGKDGYRVEDGKLVCPRRGGGNVYVDKEYANFVLRFEFKIEPGGNNGLGIRAVKDTDAAYDGYELQILENTAPGYAALQPYQYHGSIYDIVPALRGHQKAVGHWNYQEVVANGPHIRVTLNGQTIVDADIDEHKSPRVVGRHRFFDKGHVGFLGHGSRVEFRNIRIQELP